MATQEDISYLLNHLNRYLSVHLTRENIISVYAGYRPLLRSRSTGHSTAKLSRTHAVLQSPSGLVTIVGGKMTTYRRMAQDTVDVLSQRDGLASPPHPTQNLPLQGSAGWPAAKRELEVKGASLGLSAEIIVHLGHSYGSEAITLLSLIEKDASLAMLLIDDLPYIRAEVIYACRYEMAMTPYDVLARRTSIILVDRQRGLEVLDEVAALMAKELNWTPEQQQSMANAYRTSVGKQLASEQLAQMITE
jgi:glycerol-3-phosphate dehydrogenase